VLDIGVAHHEWWDEWLHVHGEQDEVRIEFQNPCWRHSSALVRLCEALVDGPSARVIPDVPDTSSAANESISPIASSRRKNRAHPLSGRLADLDLAVALIQAMPPKDTVK
jgi:hypothetical protein